MREGGKRTKVGTEFEGSVVLKVMQKMKII